MQLPNITTVENPDLIDVNIDFDHNIIKELLDINLSIRNSNLQENSFIKYGSQKQFEKGYRRLYDWFHLKEYDIIYLSDNNKMDIKFLKPLKHENKDAYYFCMSGLIILFQVFSDGNHRTAQEYYFKNTGKCIDYKKMEKINHLFSTFDYYGFRINEHKIYEMINMILDNLVKIFM